MIRPHTLIRVGLLAVLLSGSLSWPLSTELHAQSRAKESDYFTVDNLHSPQGALLEVGGLDFLPGGELVVSTRRGQVWIADNPMAEDPKNAQFRLFAEGLQECLGLTVHEGSLYVLQRGEITRLLDRDGDGTCDAYETICNDWGLSGNYHEFAYGLPVDDQGNFYVALNVAFFSPKWWHGKSTVPYRGWVLKVSPQGEMTPFASGFRSPCGIGRDREGRLYVTDNQGDWMATCPLFHVREGHFYGHPASLNWTAPYRADGRTASDTEPPPVKRTPPAVWLPYGWSRSAGNMVEDTSGGRFSPFEDQLFVAELTNGNILRVSLEEVQGQRQGAVFMFRRGVGSAVRLAFAPDRSLFIGRTNRGWGGQRPANGVGRVRPTGRIPMEMHHVALLEDGFEITFTKKLDRDCHPDRDDVELSLYDYNYWWEYGSPEMRNRPLDITSVEVLEDRRHMIVRTDGLRAGKIARMRLSRIRGAGGTRLLHREFNYTLNQLRGSERSPEMVAKVVHPPRPKEKANEGWLMLCRGDYRPDWKGEGWNAGDVRLRGGEPAHLELDRGEDGSDPAPKMVLSKTSDDTPGNAESRFDHGDVEMVLKFFLPEGGQSGVFLMGRYEIELNAIASENLTPEHCGGLSKGPQTPGLAPALASFRGPGLWHTLSVVFTAPRFAEDGRKTANARFSRIRIDDILLAENVEVEEPTHEAPYRDERPLGPLVLQGSHGAVAFRDVRIRSLDPVSEQHPSWEPLFNGIDLEGWKSQDDHRWTVERGMMKGSGPRSHLFSPRDDYKDFEFRAWVRVNDGGNSGMYFRTTFGPGWPRGYEAQVNSTHHDPIRTGSLHNLHNITTALIPKDTWFHQRIRCRDREDGVHIQVFLNGIMVSDFLDKERRHSRGHIALQQHHEGSIVHYRDVEVRELNEDGDA